MRPPALLRFARSWVRPAFAEGVEVAALSCPSGNAKTHLAGRPATLTITPGSPLWQRGIETLAVSASLEQSSVLLGFTREALGARGEAEYRWLDSGQRLACTHKPMGTKLCILSSSAKRAMGLSQFGLILADEPGAWGTRGGALMYHALRQSLDTRARQRVVLIGTRAPAEPGPGWPELLEAGSGPGRHVTLLAARPGEAWDSWPMIRRCNPMVNANPSLPRTILRERDEARRSDALRRAFEAFRLNRMVDVANEVLAEATEDVAASRRVVADGPLSIAPECRALARVGLAAASVASDDQGSVRLVKRRASRFHDDMAVAAVLAAGVLVRSLARRPPRRTRYALVG